MSNILLSRLKKRRHKVTVINMFCLRQRVLTQPQQPAPLKPSFPRLSSNNVSIKHHYDVVVVGSGYGGSIAASRCARAGQSVCVLERGKEWLPGDFPETFLDASKEVQMHAGGKEHKIGKSVSNKIGQNKQTINNNNNNNNKDTDCHF